MSVFCKKCARGTWVLLSWITEDIGLFKIEDFKIQEFYWHNSDRCSFTKVTQEKQYKHAYNLHNSNKKQSYTM